jgi:hypothetical protein
MKTGAAVFLVVLGTAQMLGDLAGFLPLKAVAAATAASPAPKVFSAVRGLETYSTRFFLVLGDRRVELTPELYARIRGPYNRRNVYGAALAYGPVLPRQLREPVMRYALCDSTLLHEMGLPNARTVAVELEPLPGTSLGELPTRFEVRCR